MVSSLYSVLLSSGAVLIIATAVEGQPPPGPWRGYQNNYFGLDDFFVSQLRQQQLQKEVSYIRQTLPQVSPVSSPPLTGMTHLRNPPGAPPPLNFPLKEYDDFYWPERDNSDTNYNKIPNNKNSATTMRSNNGNNYNKIPVTSAASNTENYFKIPSSTTLKVISIASTSPPIVQEKMTSTLNYFKIPTSITASTSYGKIPTSTSTTIGTTPNLPVISPFSTKLPPATPPEIISITSTLPPEIQELTIIPISTSTKIPVVSTPSTTVVSMASSSMTSMEPTINNQTLGVTDDDNSTQQIISGDISPTPDVDNITSSVGGNQSIFDTTKNDTTVVITSSTTLPPAVLIAPNSTVELTMNNQAQAVANDNNSTEQIASNNIPPTPSVDNTTSSSSVNVGGNESISDNNDTTAVIDLMGQTNSSSNDSSTSVNPPTIERGTTTAPFNVTYSEGNSSTVTSVSNAQPMMNNETTLFTNNSNPIIAGGDYLNVTQAINATEEANNQSISNNGKVFDLSPISQAANTSTNVSLANTTAASVFNNVTESNSSVTIDVQPTMNNQTVLLADNSSQIISDGDNLNVTQAFNETEGASSNQSISNDDNDNTVFHLSQILRAANIGTNFSLANTTAASIFNNATESNSVTIDVQPTVNNQTVLLADNSSQIIPSGDNLNVTLASNVTIGTNNPSKISSNNDTADYSDKTIGGCVNDLNVTLMVVNITTEGRKINQSIFNSSSVTFTDCSLLLTANVSSIPSESPNATKIIIGNNITAPVNLTLNVTNNKTGFTKIAVKKLYELFSRKRKLKLTPLLAAFVDDNSNQPKANATEQQNIRNSTTLTVVNATFITHPGNISNDSLILTNVTLSLFGNGTINSTASWMASFAITEGANNLTATTVNVDMINNTMTTPVSKNGTDLQGAVTLSDAKKWGSTGPYMHVSTPKFGGVIFMAPRTSPPPIKQTTLSKDYDDDDYFDKQ